MNGHTYEKVKFVPGDLLWTKVGGYPFWPCMITYDPVTSVYVRPVKKRGITHTSYHVQYFGQNVQRGWTSPGIFSSFPFKGEKDFDDQAELLKSKINDLGDKAPKSLTLSLSKLKVSSAYKEKWRIAVKEAEDALLCSNAKERFESYVFSFGTSKKTSSVNGTPYQVKVSISSARPVASASKKIKLSEDSDIVCVVCQKSSIDFSCYACTKSFHLGCVGLTKFPVKFKCIECISASLVVLTRQTGKSNKAKTISTISSEQTETSNETNGEVCFVCQKSSDVIKCSLSKCNKYYHVDCMHKYECTNKEKNVCPCHTCLTCYRGNPKNIMARKGPMVECTRCPTAFHSRESCIAAGSVELSSQNDDKIKSIICPYHYVGKHNAPGQQTCNMTSCSLCSQGGELICCEACPNAFHKICLDINIPSDDFICEDCENRRYLLYGMVVWGKVGNYRWWPGKIVHPSNLPQNIKDQKHCNGEFAVQYYGTYDYSWTHSGRVFPYTEDHKKCKATSTKFKEKYRKGLEEAAKAFDEYLRLRHHDSLLDKRPAAFKLIKVNRALRPAQITISKNAIEPCICDPTKANPCGPESGCINRSVLTECHHEFCKAKGLCQNQMFQKRQYAETKLIKTKDRGWGLAALQIITKGQFVTEYIGEIITHEEYRKRSGVLLDNGDANYYFLYLDAQRMIDAGPMGNMSRFINHSCEPNCQMMKWIVNGDYRIGIFAIKDISPGEEITFDYQSDKYEFEQKCFCGASKCQGFIGKKATTTHKGSAPVNRSSIPKNVLQKHDSNVSSMPATNSVPGSAPNPDPVSNNAAADAVPDHDAKKIPHPVYDFPPSPIQMQHSMLAKVALTRLNKAIITSLDEIVTAAAKHPKKSEKKCFVCKEPGTVIFCNEIGCGKAYHLKCARLTRKPREEWLCDIHFCKVCTKPSHLFCSACPTSFCLNCWQRTPLPENFYCQMCDVKSRKIF